MNMETDFFNNDDSDGVFLRPFPIRRMEQPKHVGISSDDGDIDAGATVLCYIKVRHFFNVILYFLIFHSSNLVLQTADNVLALEADGNGDVVDKPETSGTSTRPQPSLLQCATPPRTAADKDETGDGADTSIRSLPSSITTPEANKDSPSPSKPLLDRALRRAERILSTAQSPGKKDT